MNEQPQDRVAEWLKEARDNPHVRLSPGIANDIQALVDLTNLAQVWPADFYNIAVWVRESRQAFIRAANGHGEHLKRAEQIFNNRAIQAAHIMCHELDERMAGEPKQQD